MASCGRTYKALTVRVEAKRGTTESYAWGRKAIKFVRCATCGCVIIRNFGLEVLNSVRVRPLDGAAWGGTTH